MGHIRLGALPQSKKWRAVVELLKINADLDQIAEVTAKASQLDLDRASDEPNVQFIIKLENIVRRVF